MKSLKTLLVLLVSAAITFAQVPCTSITTVNNIQLYNWQEQHDPGTGGSATGTNIVNGNEKEFSMSYSDYGGELYHTTFGSDTKAVNFVYDAQVYIKDNAEDIANLEFDMNQVLSNGYTVIYGFQCDGWSGTWDYTVNKGTPQKPIDTWVHSNVSCTRPRNWEPDTWHTIEIAYHRSNDNLGNVTYDYVTFDGVKSELTKATGNSAFALGWSSVLLTNFQIVGVLPSDGSADVLLNNVSVSRW